MSIRIKICGITQYDDAKTAISLGVDALGFVFYPGSPRNIAPAAVREIISRLPAMVNKVGVFVDESYETIMRIASQSGIDTVQLHGNEPPELCGRLPYTTIKAFGVQSGFDPLILARYPAQSFLLDTWKAGFAGGTGEKFDWSIALSAVQVNPHIILAGGLGPSNILEALDFVRPYGVDLNSGVEIRPGLKNPYKMKDAVALIRAFK